jgi:hypothetical protein
MSTSRSALSHLPVLKGRNLQLEPRSLRSNPTNTTTTHSLRNPPDEAMSHDPQDILIPAPPQEYSAFVYWLRCHFAPFISDEFEQFLIVVMRLQSLQELADFINTCDPKTLHESIGSRKYDAVRQGIIDLKIIWYFIQQAYWSGTGTTGSYHAFLYFRKKKCDRITMLFPRSEFFTSNWKPSSSSLYRDRYARERSSPSSHSYVHPHARTSSEYTSMHSGSSTPHKKPWTTDYCLRSAFVPPTANPLPVASMKTVIKKDLRWLINNNAQHERVPRIEELSDSEDSEEEPESTFFNKTSSPTEQISTEDLPPVNKGSISLFDPYYKKNELHLESPSEELKDHFSGYYSQLNLWRYNTPIVASSTFIPRRKNEDYNNTWYLCNQFPPAKASTVELPTREKKTEPVQDPVPRVKGIRGTPHPNSAQPEETSLAPNVRLKGSSRAKSQLRSLLYLLVFIGVWHCVNVVMQSHKWKEYRRYGMYYESLVVNGQDT